MNKPAHTISSHDNYCAIKSQINTPFDGVTPIVIGVDEVGRGCLFGHMTVSAVILSPKLTGEFGVIDLSASPIALLNDSKKLSPKKRALLSSHIQSICQSYVLVDIPAFVIDDINIYQATLLGMRLAIEHLISLNHITLSHAPLIIIDGNAMPILSDRFLCYQSRLQTLIKGDSKHSSIACASILAKVHRDDSMLHYAKLYPDYGLDKHKGYASKFHTHAITTFGILPEHRKSFNPMKTMLLTAKDTPN
ncbi:ribonuclease HII [Moraxella nasovis]|uniref:ribonuclease HII n=1 Tax=Moraxella nasovis TaxID=2904121 RepID=UPI001F60C10B|nr:ribonuclease HII [Moraxella nasovis]UNU73550.1 ribonuclease HII [Moraxella nasovis]